MHGEPKLYSVKGYVQRKINRECTQALNLCSDMEMFLIGREFYIFLVDFVNFILKISDKLLLPQQYFLIL